MRKLHLVGFTSDRKGLIYSARRGSKSGGFLVPIEDSLLARIEEVTRGPDGEEGGASLSPQPMPAPAPGAPGRPRSQSALTPREMQTRLRAGRTIAEVAAEAKADPEWVERFAIPILAEQTQMVELARSLTYAKPRRGESAEPLGPSVAENLADRGVQLPDDVFDAAWSAYQLHDVVWVVRIRYRSRGRILEAAWEVNVATGQLTSRNRLASDLGFVEKGARRRPAPRLDAPVAEEAPVDGVITRRASARRGKTETDGGTRPKSGGRATKARGTAAKARRPAKATTAKRTRPTQRRASESVARAPSSPKARASARTKATAKARPAPAKAKAAAKARPAAAKAKAKATAKTRSSSARTRSGTAAKRPPSAQPAKRAATRSDGPRSRARKAVNENPPGPAQLDGPANATTGLRGQNATTGLRGQNATTGLRGQNATTGVRGQNATDNPGAGGPTPEPATEDRSRVPVNRLMVSRVAASRAAAARLTDDRRVANPLPPS
ncbi:MAG TPA: septation protein SepH, partial [Acidimicrobiales bacterium]|nr:septation protein SepH [Acidimicrobiales bacterium]